MKELADLYHMAGVPNESRRRHPEDMERETHG